MAIQHPDVMLALAHQRELERLVEASRYRLAAAALHRRRSAVPTTTRRPSRGLLPFVLPEAGGVA